MSCVRVTRPKMTDKISNLPDNVIDLILSRLPLWDAVKTSSLSTKWRFHWMRIESLVFDRCFSDMFLHYGPDHTAYEAYLFASVVDFILLSHVGPIHKLHLDIPELSCSLIPSAVNVWIRLAGRCGIQDLTLIYGEDPGFCQFPSSIFQCTELKHLSLEYVDFGTTACNFGNFPFLRSLVLIKVNISGDMLTNIFMKCPLLESFRLDSDTIELSDGPFVIQAPKLNLLSVTYYGYPVFILKNNWNISSLSLKDDASEFLEDVNTYQDMVNYFGAVSNVEDIDVNGAVLLVSSSFFSPSITCNFMEFWIYLCC